MINILLIAEYNNLTRKLINYISCLDSNIKLFNISTNLKESIDAINTLIPDIIILDIDYKYYCATNLIKYLFDKNLSKYINSIILWYEYSNKYNLITTNPFINCIINKNNNFEAFKNIIKNISNSSHILNYKIEQILASLNFNFSYNGTKYIYESLNILCFHKNPYNANFEKEVYPLIARKYHKSISNIKGNILHAIDIMYFDCDEQNLYKLLKLYPSCKPSPKKVILFIIDYIKKPSVF